MLSIIVWTIGILFFGYWTIQIVGWVWVSSWILIIALVDAILIAVGAFTIAVFSDIKYWATRYRSTS